VNKQILEIKKMSVYISLAAILTISAIAIPMQNVQAQTTEVEELVIRFVGAVGQAGLVNVAVTNVAVPVNIEDINVLTNPVITIPVTVLANVPVTVCAVSVNVIGASGGQSCRVVNEAQLENDQVIILPVRPAPNA
jgi:hypothetical protein